MIPLNWANLRPWRNSLEHAFEELCAQLAAHEIMPAGAEYRRIGAPDAGVECIWREPNGKVHGWQAKFFRFAPTPAQWSQIDKSVRQALKVYPTLATYTVCLPIDRADARIKGQESMMDRWDARVLKWEKAAAAIGLEIEFPYWGEHEIADRLARPEHTGRAYFWFSATVLSSPWFRQRFNTTKANAGPRYSPELNVDVPISDVFDALVKHPRYIGKIQKQWGKTKHAIDHATPSDKQLASTRTSLTRDLVDPTHPLLDDATDTALKRIELTTTATNELVATMNASVRALESDPRQPTPLAELIATAQRLAQTLYELRAAAEMVRETSQAARRANPKEPVSGIERSVRTRAQDPNMWSAPYEHARTSGWDAVRELEEFMRLLQDDSAGVVNSPALLVIGDAGTGKTHLMCDVADRATAASEPCVVLLGEHFTRADPWSQVLQQLELTFSTPDEFLGALSAAAEAKGRRALLMIDALNEGAGKLLWRDHLSGLLATIARFPWIAVAFSVRSSYERLIVPEPARAKLTYVEHQGFAERETDATRRFFDAYGLERPNVPLLTPEFSNPLFLKLFCSGIQKRGLVRVPDGLEGISAIFTFFLESVQEEIARPNRLDFDPKSGIVDRALSALASEMVACGSQWVTRDRATTILHDLLPTTGFENSLVRALLSEGVLSEELVWAGTEGDREEVIRFTYERLSDHRIARLLLDAALTAEGELRPEAEVERPRTQSASHERGPLTIHRLVADEEWRGYYRGILNAIAIQAPERIGREFWELFPQGQVAGDVDAFLESLLWRRPSAIGDTALKIVAHYLRARSDIGDRTRNLLVSTASRPAHPLNADYLDRALRTESMADRDVWWSTYIASQGADDSPAGRLIDWSWRAGNDLHYSTQTVELASTALAWMLSTPHRKVRDYATKAMVSLLHNRPTLLRLLLERFADVNDPYVAERLHAVAYGCALRGLPAGELRALATDVFARTFAANPTPAHLLLRDYARGIVEMAAASGAIDNIDITMARPPYHSDPPGAAPSNDELALKYEAPFKSTNDAGYSSLWHSLSDWGDFARYIVGTNSQSFPWSARPIEQAATPIPRHQYEAFVDKLPDDLRSAWYDLRHRTATLDALRGKSIALPTGEKFVVDERLVQASKEDEEATFKTRLSVDQHEEFERVKNWADEPYEPYPFDLRYALRWLFNRVIEMGWTPERFNWFDRNTTHANRTEHASERIGKKYQWIALHEFMARVADHFEFVRDRWNTGVQHYDGPWQFHRRDIDPSYLGRAAIDTGTTRRSTWWQPPRYTPRHADTDEAWLTATNDLPTLASIASKRDALGDPWLLMRGDVRWCEPRREGDFLENASRWLEYSVTCCFVNRGSIDSLVKWAEGRDLASIIFHDSASTTQVFLGEYPWAPSFRNTYPTLIAKPWTRFGGTLPVAVTQPAVRYYWESAGYDQSITAALQYFVPAPVLIGITPGARRQAVSRADLVNPAVNPRHSDLLLCRESSVRALLYERDWEAVWLMTGQKQLWGGEFWGSTEDYAGRQEISGIGYYSGNSWRERLVAYFQRGSDNRYRLK